MPRRRPPQDSLGRFIRHEGSSAPQPAPHDPPPPLETTTSPQPDRAPKQRRRPTQFKHFRVDEVLTDEQRKEYERLLARPTTTVKDLLAKLREWGHPVCRSAVSRHRRSWSADVKRLREVSRMASTFCELARERGPGVIAEATHAKFETDLMASLFNMPGAEDRPLAYWQQMSRTLGGVVATRRSVEEMRTEYDQKIKAAATEAGKAADSGASGKDVVARMREILGV